MQIAECAAILETVRCMPFPAHAISDALEDLLMELLELDSHYAGLARSAIDGSNVLSELGTKDLEQLLPQLKSLSVEGADRDTLESTIDYANKLVELDSCIRALAGR